MVDHEEVLRRLTLGDEAFLSDLIAERRARPARGRLDGRDEALVRFGALAARNAPGPTWQRTVAAALDAGLTPSELADALVVLAPVLGSTRVASNAPKVGLALGYDVEAELEAPPPRTAIAR